MTIHIYISTPDQNGTPAGTVQQTDNLYWDSSVMLGVTVNCQEIGGVFFFLKGGSFIRFYFITSEEVAESFPERNQQDSGDPAESVAAGHAALSAPHLPASAHCFPFLSHQASSELSDELPR